MSERSVSEAEPEICDSCLTGGRQRCQIWCAILYGWLPRWIARKSIYKSEYINLLRFTSVQAALNITIIVRVLQYNKQLIKKNITRCTGYHVGYRPGPRPVPRVPVYRVSVHNNSLN